jgi:hypothetical protein
MIAHVEIPLTDGHVALVDVDDYDAVAAHRWHTAKGENGRTHYARRRTKRGETHAALTIRLHTFLTGWPEVDHRNGDGLDNRRTNLRNVNHAQNSANQRRPRNNRSGFKGVSWRQDIGRWAAHIGVNYRLRHLGMFDTAEDAARAYDTAAIETWGEYASLNFEPEGVVQQ